MSRKSSEGSYSITSPGITERISTSAPTFGAAISKAQTLAGRLQREIRRQDEMMQSIFVRRIGEDKLLARVDVHPDIIETYAATGAR